MTWMHIYKSNVVVKSVTILHDCPVKILPYLSFYRLGKGAQWLSGRVLDLRPRGHGFEPHRHHCVVSLSKTH